MIVKPSTNSGRFSLIVLSIATKLFVAGVLPYLIILYGVLYPTPKCFFAGYSLLLFTSLYQLSPSRAIKSFTTLCNAFISFCSIIYVNSLFNTSNI